MDLLYSRYCILYRASRCNNYVYFLLCIAGTNLLKVSLDINPIGNCLSEIQSDGFPTFCDSFVVQTNFHSASHFKHIKLE